MSRFLSHLLLASALILPECFIFSAGALEPAPSAVCSMDAKSCPDGSAVGRTGPDCAFAPCPSSLSRTVDLTEEPYGSHPKQTLDVFLPSNPVGAPILVMVHGGAWAMGDKANAGVIETKRRYWGAKGYVLVSINYRLVPEVTVAEQVEDVARALAWVHRHAGVWGADPQKMILMGHSAGAHLVAMLGADPSAYSALGGASWRGTVLLDSGALDVPDRMNNRHFRFYDKAFGANPHAWKTLSPLHRLEPPFPPFYVVCSTQHRGACEESQRFVAQVQALGGTASLNIQPLKHGEVSSMLGEPNPYTYAVDQFMEAVLQEPMQGQGSAGWSGAPRTED